MKDHISKNLCHFGHDKYTPKLDCPQKKKLQLFLMEVKEEQLEQQDPETIPEAVEVEIETEQPVVTLNSL